MAVKKVNVNGIPAVVQRDYESGLFFVYFQTVEGKIFEGAFFPVYAEPLFDLVIASIQPAVEEEASAEPVVSVNPVSALIHK